MARRPVRHEQRTNTSNARRFKAAFTFCPPFSPVPEYAGAVKARLPLLLCCLSATGLFELFFHYDWDEGVVRGVLVGALLALVVLVRLWPMTFPAAFLLPLLLGTGVRRGRAIAGFGVVSLLTWGPAFAVDGLGVWDNVFRFNIERGADSTALAFYLSPAVMQVLRVLIVVLCAAAFWRLVWRTFEPVTFVTLCMGLFFLLTKVFHNNYLVWWLPMVGVCLARALTFDVRFLSPAPSGAARSSFAPE